jgi:hypothetical protein
MTTIEFIPKEKRRLQSELVLQISNAVFGDIDKISFSERFVPLMARVPEPKVQNFSNFLINFPKHLWAIRYNNIVVGFILISDNPHNNSIGFGIDIHYTRLNISYNAWQLIKSDILIKYPLNAYTSQKNVCANNFLTKIGFLKTDDTINFMGEPSFKYIKQK